jgi:hypothetical protein
MQQKVESRFQKTIIYGKSAFVDPATKVFSKEKAGLGQLVRMQQWPIIVTFLISKKLI